MAEDNQHIDIEPPKSMRQLGLSVNLSFEEFLQRQKHFLAVSSQGYDLYIQEQDWSA